MLPSIRGRKTSVRYTGATKSRKSTEQDQAMKRDSRSGNWSVCLCIAVGMTWVIPLDGMVNSQKTANAMPAADDEDSNEIGDVLRTSPWFKEVLVPTAGLIGANPTDYGTMLLGLQLGCSNGFVPGHGDSMVGAWGGTPVLFEVASGFDLTRSIGKELDQTGGGEDLAQFQEFYINGGRCVQINGVMTNLKTGEIAGLSLERWTLPHESDPPSCIIYTKDFWTPEIPYGVQGPFGMFLDYFEYVDATSSNEGYQRWMARIREEGPSSHLCAYCPPVEGDAGPPPEFCPARYIYVHDQDGNPTDEFDLSNCLGKAFSNFQRCRDIAQENYTRCALGSTVGIGVGLGSVCFLLSAPPAIAACLLATTGYAVYSRYSCVKSLKLEMEQCFSLLEPAFLRAAEAACSRPPTTCPTY